MVFILYIVALCSFITGQLLRFSFSSGFVIQVTDVIVFIAVASWAIAELRKGTLRNHLRHPYTKPLMFFALTGLLSLLVNSISLNWIQVVVSSLYLFRWIVYAIIFFEVKSFSVEKRKTVVRGLIVISVVIILLGYLQYIFYPNLKILYHLGWDDHLYRLFSTFLDPNFAAVVLSLISLLSLGYLFGRKRLLDKGLLGATGLFILSFVALLLTYSRGGFLTFATGSIVLFALLKKRLYLISFLALLIVGIVILPKNLHSAGVELWRTASIFARTESANQALKIFSDNPILGVGFDTYRYAQKRYHFAYGNNWEQSHSGGGTDNSFLFVLATTGVVGIAVYLFMWWTIVSRTYNAYKIGQVMTRKKTLSLVVLASCGALIVNSFFINSLFYTFVLFWMWTLLGLIEEVHPEIIVKQKQIESRE